MLQSYNAPLICLLNTGSSSSGHFETKVEDLDNSEDEDKTLETLNTADLNDYTDVDDDDNERQESGEEAIEPAAVQIRPMNQYSN